MNPQRLKKEYGQSLVIIALGMIAFIAILALVLDGANAYAAKRQAQNAADAGALAGATYMCKNHDEAGGVDQAEIFAVKNGAVNPPDVYASLSAGTVVVTATVERDTFFAGVIGFDQVTPRAVAAAECRPPVGMGVLPVAWACRDTVVGNGIVVPGVDCAQKTIDDCNGNPYDLNCTYILMDSVKVKKHSAGGNCDPTITDPLDKKYCYCDPYITDPLDPMYCTDLLDRQDLECSAHLDAPTCSAVQPNTIDCDINDDCVDELMAGGARSWLDLDGGGGGASELTDWITNGFPNPIPPHKWIPEESGVATSIFHTAADEVVGEDVILPVFNHLCDHYPDISTYTETVGACEYYPAWDDRSIASSSMNFHIITFAQFHVTCVQTGKNTVTADSASYPFVNNHCIGHEAAANNEYACDPNPPYKCLTSIDDNDKTIEGYFEEVNLGGYSGPGDWFDTGTFTVVLVR
jgi:hypothetical protein